MRRCLFCSGFRTVLGERYVFGLRSLGPLSDLKFNGRTFFNCSISRSLDSGEVHKHILPVLPLDKPKPFCSVEPFHYPFFSHVLVL